MRGGMSHSAPRIQLSVSVCLIYGHFWDCKALLVARHATRTNSSVTSADLCHLSRLSVTVNKSENKKRLLRHTSCCRSVGGRAGALQQCAGDRCHLCVAPVDLPHAARTAHVATASPTRPHTWCDSARLHDVSPLQVRLRRLRSRFRHRHRHRHYSPPISICIHR